MCPKREWFSTYKSYDEGSVLIGNDVCKTVGIGNIRMSMFIRLVRTLTNVRRDLDLRKNILSLEALKAQRCKFSGADGGIKVTKGSMTILKEHIANLYKIEESIIVGDASAATEEDTTKALAHASWTHERARSSSPTQKGCSTMYQIL